MAFESLLGNERLKQNLSVSVGRGRASHFYLISGPKGSGKHTLANLLAQALLCTGESKPCGTCAACRKVAADTHPDFITVEDPDHKELPVRMVRDARESMFVRPNEGSHKIYLFPQTMRIEGQNALLKILEEPPGYGVFILLSENPEQLLTTIRSRATELKLLPVEPVLLKSHLAKAFPEASSGELEGAIRRSSGYVGQAMELLSGNAARAPEVEAFVEAFSTRDALGLLQVLVPMEKKPRDQALPIFSAWKEALQEGLTCRSGLPPVSQSAAKLSAARSGQDLLRAIRALQKAIEYAQGNVSVAAICGWLTQTLR